MKSTRIVQQKKSNKVDRREQIAWGMFDFANSGYTTVVMTTIFSAYFVGVVAGGPGGYSSGEATFLWTLAVGFANFCVLLSAPIIGAIADYRAAKKQFLLVTTLICASATAMLAMVGSGDVMLAIILIVISAIMFASGENLISAFLPEIVSNEKMGRMSGYGWGLGYFGGLLTLGLCLIWIVWGQKQGWSEEQLVPVTMLITAAVFIIAATPTFLWMRERRVPEALPSSMSYFHIGFLQVRKTLQQAKDLPDLFRFLTALSVYQSGVATVVVLSAVYAREVMGFDSQSLIILIMVVNITASFGALFFGYLQDRIGSVRSLSIILLIWSGAIIMMAVADQRATVWLAANMIGLALGASQAVGRAMVGRLTPVARTAEFFGLWGMATRLASIVGPVSYGLISYLSGGNHRLALISTLSFFIVGLWLLRRVDEQRGREVALSLNHAAVRDPAVDIEIR